ncbi:aminotransferase class I/II-fold pyridoxal phosphate-dependent enzyme [[Clostridium] colinum]|uniref:aminotransferase class I/II-fold pyridoxal phosphate-dependent enzyme n=1 Tax=[Clostridium] colinum TaxID=36835 RepID=UPI0020253DD4|nr:aminotransferase class I/II-fold pyridoxal phosphate-dependent enzyme [[Clostridium] colinum]
MDRPIYDMLKYLDNKNIYPFHMPGHKRNKKFLNDFYDFINLDFTEIDETDNMHKPEGIIKKSKQLISSTFGSDESYFLVNGSSGGIIASIMACVKPNEQILVARNCHISVYNGVVLSGASPIYINPTIKYNLPCGIDLENVKSAIEKYPNIKAFVLTSPTYEGFVSDIESIANILHKKGIVLIVDEAHGAHFNFSNNFPNTAIKCGADIVIQSFHKTLPSFTQCGVLHLNSNIVDKNRLEKCLSITQTTSPSYMFMLSIEYATNFCKNNIKDFNDYTLFLKNLRKDLKSLKNIKLIDDDILKNSNIVDFDISRFTFLINSNINGHYINSILKQNNIQLEMYGKNHIIAISTICDDFDKLTYFKEILFKIDNDIVYNNINYINIKDNTIIKPFIIPREAFYSEKYLLDIDLCLNKICGDFVTPYPPGIPILAPGEIVTKDIILKIKSYIKNNINVIGLNKNNQISILQKNIDF